MQTIFQIQLQFMVGTVLLLLCRPLLTRFPKIVSYSLWCVLFLRLLCPFSLPTDSAIWSAMDISKIAERDTWQEPGKEGKTAERIIAAEREQTSAENIAERTKQSEIKDGIDGIKQTGMGDRTNDAGQTGTENGIDEIKQAEPGDRMEDAGQTGTGNAAEGNGQIVTGQLHDIGNGTDKTGQTEAGNWHAIQNVGNRIAFAVKSLLAEIYHWLDAHAVLLAVIWVAGMVLCLLHALYAVCKYRCYVKRATVCPEGKPVYESGGIASPFVFGILHTKIVLPQGLSDNEREYIVCHEEMHIRRKDYLVKWVVFLLTRIYWFQPFVWVAAHYLEQDMEMSCDEMVIQNMGDGIKKAYAQSLLSFAEGKRQEMLPLAFASSDVKRRIRNVLQPKRFRKWMIPVSVMLVLSFAIILFTQQKGQNNNRNRQEEVQQTADRTSAAAVSTPAGEDSSNNGKDGADETEEAETSDVYSEIMATNAIERNFGKFYDYDDADTNYETYFISRYQQYRIDDLSKWKDDKGEWCYPKEYEFAWVPPSVSYMAAQQFPPELLEDMDTEELLSFILKGKKDYAWGWGFFDTYLMGLSLFYQQYNFVHELMNREDCAEVVHRQYQQYSEDDIKKYSKQYGGHYETQECYNFRLIEGLEWFFMALEGKDVPDEYTYGSELEKTLDNPSRPKEFVFQEDVTHDGKKDTITLHMESLYDESLATGEEETVTVTSGKTGKKIASYTADTVHYGWNGLYLYEDYLGKYLVNWKPVMYQGVGTFQLRVFSLKENGKEDVLLEKKFRFELNPGRIDFDQKAFQDYMDLVNSYLRNSYVIIDTDQGEVMYGTEEGALMAPYDASWVIDTYKERKRQEK